MTDLDILYKSWMVNGSYFNNMLNCGDRYNEWVEIALGYLPVEVLDKHKDKLVFISIAQADGRRVARHSCENREVILLSERVLPKKHAVEDQPEVRYFIFVVLHEIVHAIKKHKSQKFDGLSVEQNEAQETEADDIAFKWFNQHIKELNNEYLQPITREEVEKAQQLYLKLIEKIYEGV